MFECFLGINKIAIYYNNKDNNNFFLVYVAGNVLN